MEVVKLYCHVMVTVSSDVVVLCIYVVFSSILSCSLVMFYYCNCVVLSLLFVVWLFVSINDVDAATSRGRPGLCV